MEETEAKKIISDTKRLRKKQRPKRSRLFRYKSDITELKKNGAPYETIALWLRKNKGVKTTWQNIQYFYKTHCEKKYEDDEGTS